MISRTKRVARSPDGRSRVALLARQLDRLELGRHLRSPGGELPRRGRGAFFMSHDNAALLEALITSPRLCRDTATGGMLHPGRISFRELPGGLHISLGPGNRIYMHVDGVSPAVGATSGGRCVYERARAAAHFRRDVLSVLPDLARARPSRGRHSKWLQRGPLSPGRPLWGHWAPHPEHQLPPPDRQTTRRGSPLLHIPARAEAECRGPPQQRPEILPRPMLTPGESERRSHGYSCCSRFVDPEGSRR